MSCVKKLLEDGVALKHSARRYKNNEAAQKPSSVATATPDCPPSTNRGGTERPAIATVQELRMVMTDTGEVKTVLVRRPVNEQIAMIDTLRFTVGEETWNRTAREQLVGDECFVLEASRYLEEIFGFGVTRDLKKSRDFYTNAWELGDNYGHVAMGGAGQRQTMLINLNGKGCIAAKAGWESRLHDFLVDTAVLSKPDIAPIVSTGKEIPRGRVSLRASRPCRYDRGTQSHRRCWKTRTARPASRRIQAPAAFRHLPRDYCL